MKIGIDARFLTHPQMGGFKTYTVNLVNALKEVDTHNQYVLYLDREPAAASNLPEARNFTYRIVPAALPMVGMPYREQISLRRQIARDNLDVAHFLCNTAPVAFNGKFVLSLLDVIQVHTPQHFSVTTGLENYRRKLISEYSKWAILRTVRKAARVLTLSEFEKGEIVKYLGVPAEQVGVTYFGVNSVFAQGSAEQKAEWRKQASEKYGIRSKFVMGVGYEPRKNIPLLMRAFAALGPHSRDLDLVIVAAEKEMRAHFKELAGELKIADRAKIMAALPPSELAALYNLTDAFVFPSTRESFGAPPLEALACGAPVAAMNLTSLPEVLGDGAMLLDGTDVQTWSSGINRILTDSELRRSLTERGLRQAARLTWRKCAEDTVRVYEEVVGTEQAVERRMSRAVA